MMSEGHSYGTDNLRHNFQTTKRERPNAIIASQSYIAS